MNQLFESVVRKAAPESTEGRALSFVKFNTSVSSGRFYPKVLFFCFADTAPEPIFCIKTVRSSRDNAVIERGYADLQTLNRYADAAGTPGLFARAIVLGTVDGITYAIESAVSGHRPSGSELTTALRAYTEFQRSLLSARKDSNKLETGNGLIAGLDLHERVRTELTAYWARIAGDSATHTVAHLPQHGDFTADNVLVSGDSVTLIDCDQYDEQGLAGFDMFYFLERTPALAAGFSTHMRDYLRMFGNDGRFDVSDVFLWYLTERFRKQKDMGAGARNLTVSVQDFKELVSTLRIPS